MYRRTTHTRLKKPSLLMPTPPPTTDSLVPVVPDMYTDLWTDQLFVTIALPGTFCFNGGCIAVDRDGVTLGYDITPATESIRLLYRHLDTKSGNTNLFLVDVDPTTFQRPVRASMRVLSIGRREDPRIFRIKANDLYTSYTHVTTTADGKHDSRIGVANLMTQQYIVDEVLLARPPKSIVEKNWVFFEQAGLLYTIYSTCPFRLFRISEPATWSNLSLVAKYEWTHPQVVLRGGAPPILIGETYYIFVHSATTYDIYVVTMDTNFNLMAYTEFPVVKKTPNQCIHFTCGALYDRVRDQFVICVGVDDAKVCMVTCGRAALDRCLISRWKTKQSPDVPICRPRRIPVDPDDPLDNPDIWV